MFGKLIYALPFLLNSGVKAQIALGGGAGSNPDTTGSQITTTTYINAPTAAEPPIIQGPWADADHLEGTWSSKSMTVFTGPDFYDPVDELLIEPALPGISFSFTKDGFFEQAMYQVTSNPKDPKCPAGALTFQHGTYKITQENKLELYPLEDDGRQLVSDPCNSNTTDYVLYDQQLEFSKFEVVVDLYHGRYRLDLYQFDGTPLPPMYLVYRPPQMLPTETLNPGVKNGLSAASKRGVSANIRDRIQSSLINRSKTKAKREVVRPSYYDSIWWLGVILMAVGATGYIYLA